MAATRGIVAVAVALGVAGSPGFADPAPPTQVAAADPPPHPPPDPIADIESAEANLESDAPRSGLMFALAVGTGLLMGGDIGIGTGGAVSLRVGHVATRRTVITFELTATGALHKRGTDDAPVTDTNAGLFAGAQSYASPSTWIRVAGGPTVFNANVGDADARRTVAGVGGLLSGGLDIARWGYLVLGLEALTMGSVTRDGVKFQLGFALGLSYY